MLSAKAAEHATIGRSKILCEELRIIAAFRGAHFKYTLHVVLQLKLQLNVQVAIE